MDKNIFPLNKRKWLEEGFIFQNSQQDYFLGQGPLSYSSRPTPQSLYHPDFFLQNQKPWLKPSWFWKVKKKDLASFLLEYPMAEVSTEKDKPKKSGSEFFINSETPSFIQYQEIFAQAQQAIGRNVFQKIVPVFCEKFAFNAHRLLLIQNLFQNTYQGAHGFLYGAWNKDEGILGWTPEILFSLQGDQFFTMALAGTGVHPGPLLLKDKKEFKEHDLVVQGLEELLKDFVHWDKKIMSEMLFPPLKHLCTQLSGRLIHKLDVETICKMLHPTPALGGYPKKQAFDWLKNQPSQKQRKYFGAPFGFFNFNQEFFCLVAIRALEWKQKEGRIFTGGGWIKESFLQKEWQELVLKRKQVKFFFKRQVL